jgi:hypothetical protein
VYKKLEGAVMPTRRFSIKHHRGTAGRSTFSPIGAPELNLLLKLIETERDNLSRADSLLGCLKIALEYGGTNHKNPYYPDVAQIAHEMVRKSIRALDPINLPSPSRDKVREEFSGNECAPLAVTLHRVPLLPRPVLTTNPWPCSLRMHYRKY